MSVGTGAAIAIGAGVGAAGGIGSALIGSSAAKSAAETQAQSAEAAIAEQQREFDKQQANLAPWLAAGQGVLPLLTSGTQPGGALVTPYGPQFGAGPFNAPT